MTSIHSTATHSTIIYKYSRKGESHVEFILGAMVESVDRGIRLLNVC